MKQLEETNPTATEAEQVAYASIATKPELKRRVLYALQEIGDAVEDFVLESTKGVVVMAVIKNWMKLSS